jgi:hypothetical protein
VTDKEYFIDFWTPTIGQEEAERSWEVKQAQIRIAAPMVQGDIQPYRSMIDGSIIESRSKHRAHLKQHGCIEVGNETQYLNKPKPLTPPPGLKQKLIEVANQKLRRS